MAEISKGDVQQAVQDGLRDVRNDVSRIKDAVGRIDQRTDDLDRSQEEIKQLTRVMDDVHHDADKIDRVLVEINTLRDQLQATNTYLKQVAGYLAAFDEVQRTKVENDDGYKKY